VDIFAGVGWTPRGWALNSLFIKHLSWSSPEGYKIKEGFNSSLKKGGSSSKSSKRDGRSAGKRNVQPSGFPRRGLAHVPRPTGQSEPIWDLCL
jgi:hypothetical protein